MPRIETQNQLIVLSETGGTITEWKYRGWDIFFPQQEIIINGEKKLRGGMHPCFPNFGTVDEKFGLPQHGTLRTLHADRMGNTAVHFDKVPMGSSGGFAEVNVSVYPLTHGFTYGLRAVLVGDGEDLFINPGLHPYFATPRGFAEVLHPQAVVEKVPYGPKISPIELFSPRAYIAGLGRVMMTPGQTLRGPSARIVLWRDDPRYVCIEPISATSREFNTPSGVALSSWQYLDVTCTFDFDFD